MPEMQLVIDGARMAEVLRSPAGPVARHLIERATLVQARARQIAHPHRKSGCLEDTIVKRVEVSPTALAIRIVSDTTPCSPTHTSYSLPFHEGTEPHDIVATAAGALSFDWHGEHVFFARVHHPGSTGVPFLRDALKVLS